MIDFTFLCISITTTRRRFLLHRSLERFATNGTLQTEALYHYLIYILTTLHTDAAAIRFQLGSNYSFSRLSTIFQALICVYKRLFKSRGAALSQAARESVCVDYTTYV